MVPYQNKPWVAGYGWSFTSTLVVLVIVVGAFVAQAMLGAG
jgi:hypothetical protein